MTAAAAAAGGPSALKYDVTYRDRSLMDGIFGCFKPFYNIIGKNKPSELENKEGKGAQVLYSLRA